MSAVSAAPALCASRLSQKCRKNPALP
jgi:hypothetical protein